MAESVVRSARQALPAWGRAAAIVLPILVSVFVIAPRTASILLVLSCLVFAALARDGWVRDTLLRPRFLTLWLAAFGVYLIINAGWALDLERAYGKVLFFFVVLALTHAIVAAVSTTKGDVLRQMAFPLVVAFAIAALYLLIEVVTVNAIKRTLFNVLPFLRPSPKHAQLVDGQVVHIGTYVLNRSMAALCLVLWPILAIAGVALVRRARAQMFGCAIFVLSVVAVFWSQHETSKVAIILAAAVFIVAWLLPRVSIGLVTVAWLGVSLFVVPVAFEASKAGLHTDKRLPVSARARVILWGYTADLVTKNPWLGIGVGSTKQFDKVHAKTVSIPKGQVYAQRTGKHAHNAYLQTWFELGAIGAVFLAGLGLAVLWSIWMLPGNMQPYALATFATAAVTAGLSWGMWQTWFMAFFALGFGLMALAARLAIVAAPAAVHQTD